MNNIELVTRELSSKCCDRRSVLCLVYTKDGSSFFNSGDGYYRIFNFVEGSTCLETADSPFVFRESAIAFGSFSSMLSNLPISLLTETIPNFHNTPLRYEGLKRAIREDRVDRVKEVQREIDFFLERENEMVVLQRMRESGYLPLRVAHNDTKLNNVLFDRETRKALCVIDLDTVMPGLSAYDFGDAIRFGATNSAEDERDLSKVDMSIELFRAYYDGYSSSFKGLTKQEREVFPLAALTMTAECGIRFLTDYLEGDHYFRVLREGHNLDRARTQMKMVHSMENQRDKMQRIVRL